MYENSKMLIAAQGCESAMVDDRGSKTVEENIDLKITLLQREIERLQESKKSLAPLLGMRIRDVREAMSY